MKKLLTVILAVLLLATSGGFSGITVRAASSAPANSCNITFKMDENVGYIWQSKGGNALEDMGDDGWNVLGDAEVEKTYSEKFIVLPNRYYFTFAYVPLAISSDGKKKVSVWADENGKKYTRDDLYDLTVPSSWAGKTKTFTPVEWKNVGTIVWDAGDGDYGKGRYGDALVKKVTLIGIDGQTIEYSIDAECPIKHTPSGATLLGYSESKNGSVTFKKDTSSLKIEGLKNYYAIYSNSGSTSTTKTFSDVKNDAYYKKSVDWAVEKGITLGTSNGTTFSPNDPCTRAQMVLFLYRLAGSPEVQENAKIKEFKDVKSGASYEKALNWALSKGITAGTSKTTFGPNESCTRAQMAQFLYRMKGTPKVSGKNSFIDVSNEAYYSAAVEWLKEAGITSGTTATTYSPKSICTRAQMVTFLYRYDGNK